MAKVLLDKAKRTANRLYNNFKVLQKFTAEHNESILIKLHELKNVTAKRMLADKFIEAGVYTEDMRDIFVNATHIIIVNGDLYAYDDSEAVYVVQMTTEMSMSILLDMDFDENTTFTSIV